MDHTHSVLCLRALRQECLSDQGDPSFVNDPLHVGKTALAAEGIHELLSQNSQPLTATAGQAKQNAPLQFLAKILVRRAGDEFDVLQAVAVLEPSGALNRPGLDPSHCHRVLSEVLGIDEIAVEQAMRSLAATGLLDRSRLRDERVRSAVLDHITPARHRLLNAAAARVLHSHGNEDRLIAEHLVNSGPVHEIWMIKVLRSAARAALRTGDQHRAVQYLSAGIRVDHEGDDPQVSERAHARWDLMLTQWRMSPAIAARLLPALLEDVQAQRLAAPDAILVTHALIWHGRTEHVDTLQQHSDQARPQLEPGTGSTSLWPLYWPSDRSTRLPGHSILTTVVRRRLTQQWRADIDGSVPDVDAERLARRVSLRGTPPVGIAVAVFAMLSAGQLERAETLCSRLVGEAADIGGVPGHLLNAVRAVIAGLHGNAPQAVDLARRCIDQLEATSWGVMIGLPLSAMIDGLVLMGETHSAAANLALAEPEAMLDTPAGLLYLLSRGRYHLRTGHPELALGDFEKVAYLGGRAGLDFPALLPWRLDLAETYLRMGDRPASHRIITEQMSRLPWAGAVRGTALRILAVTSRPTRQVALLKQAVQELSCTGHQLQLACARWELSEALLRRGDERRAELMRIPAHDYVVQRPWLRLSEMVFRPMFAAETPGRYGPAPGRRPPEGIRPDDGAKAFTFRSHPGVRLDVLSAAEQHVAELAGRGKKNREIAEQLQVTASTVEQHLTRVYRKLNVRNRSDLRSRLSMDPSSSF